MLLRMPIACLPTAARRRKKSGGSTTNRKSALPFCRFMKRAKFKNPASPDRWCRRSDANRLQLLPSVVQPREIFLRGGEMGVELVGLRGVRAVQIRRGEQTFDAGDFLVHGVNLRLHALQLARFLERKFAWLGPLGSRFLQGRG